MDKSFLMVFFEKSYIDPTGRQNFGDAPGQIPKLILTLCLSHTSLLLEKKSRLTDICLFFFFFSMNLSLGVLDWLLCLCI